MRTFLDKILGSIAKYLAVFFASLFVLATILVIIFFNIENTLLNAGTYKRALVQNDVYGQLPILAKGEMDTLTPFLIDQTGIASEVMDSLNNLASEDWQTLLNQVLPADAAKGIVENMLDQVFAAVNGETNGARLSLAVLKSHLTAQGSEDSIQYLLNLQPPCTDEQVAQIPSENPNATQPELCRPQQQDLALLTSQWKGRLDSAASGIPDVVVLIKPPSGPLENGAPGNDPIASLNTVRLIIRFSPLLPLLLLVLITLLGVRSLKSWLTWWGVPLLITGLITLVIGLAIPALLNWAWVNVILPPFSSVLSTGFRDLALNLVGSLAQALETPIMLEAAFIGLLGLAAVIGSFFVETKLKEPVPLAI